MLMSSNTTYIITYLGQDKKMYLKIKKGLKKKKREREVRKTRHENVEKRHDSKYSAFLTTFFRQRHGGYIDAGSKSMQLVQAITYTA